MCQQPTYVRATLLLFLGFLMLYDNQATGDATNDQILEAVNNLKIKMETMDEQLQDITEQINGRIVNEVVANVSSKLGTMTKILVNFDSNPEFYGVGEHKGSVYLLSKAARSTVMHRDQKKCEFLGGYMWEPNDREEIGYVAYAVKVVSGRQGIITGFTDIAWEGHFRHASSQIAINAGLWNPGAPRGDGDCTVVEWGKIFDVPCAWTKRFVCEIPL